MRTPLLTRKHTGITHRYVAAPNDGSNRTTRRVIETREGLVTLSIDVDAIFNRLAYSALYSKSGKSRFMRGLIEASVGPITQTTDEEGAAHPSIEVQS